MMEYLGMALFSIGFWHFFDLNVYSLLLVLGMFIWMNSKEDRK